MINKYSNIYVNYKNELVYFDKRGKFSFHLDTAKIRIKSKQDFLISLVEEKNQSILDMTMGLARDSVVFSYFNHKVVALESNDVIYNIVSYGLKNYISKIDKLTEALRNIKVININNYEYLKKCKNNSFDIIYIDPMFSHKIKNSNNLGQLELFANGSKINNKLFEEMKRVTVKKIILKAHNQDEVFEKFNFKKIKRAGAKFSFGVYEINKN